MNYFSPWRNLDSALRKHPDEKDGLHAGQTLCASGDGLTVCVHSADVIQLRADAVFFPDEAGERRVVVFADALLGAAAFDQRVGVGDEAVRRLFDTR